jgi:RNA recognition motif-containing protein
MNIFVGNLSRDVTDEELKAAFEEFGKVVKVSIIRDMFTGESKGFGFIEMPAKAEALAAIKGMGGKQLKGRGLNVSEARPRNERGKHGGRRRPY